jgi:hypothetical protein
MDGRSLYDELRALAAGTLSSEEEKRLRQRCAEDAELGRQLEDFLEVYAGTETAEPPPCRVTFEEVEGALASRRVWREVLRRYWRVAAAVLVLVGGGLLLGSWLVAPRGDGGPGRGAGALVLASIPVADSELPAVETELPASLADYHPVSGGEIHWIDSFEKARAVARLSSRPVLLFIHHPTCPICIRMKAEVFADPRVKQALTAFVPAMSNVMEERVELAGETGRGWPWFGIVDADGGVVLSFPGEKGVGDFLDCLKRATELSGPPVLGWERLNDLARRFEAARRAEKEGRLGAAYASYVALAAEEAGGVIAGNAAIAARRLALEARRALVRARGLVRSPPGVPAARAELEKAEKTFAGSPLAKDLAAVRKRLDETGEWPAIEGWPQ